MDKLIDSSRMLVSIRPAAKRQLEELAKRERRTQIEVLSVLVAEAASIRGIATPEDAPVGEAGPVPAR